MLKKDASQIGQNARKSVKFLDKMTSGKSDWPHEPVIIQGPDEQYVAWSMVEAHYKEGAADGVTQKTGDVREAENKPDTDLSTKRTSGTALSQLLLEKLNFAGPPPASPGSTPPLSPVSSGPQSSKTSPEVRAATMAAAEKSPVPPILKALLNPVVWYVHEKQHDGTEVFFLTNSADTQHLARDFKVPTKTIHQMRSTIGLEGVEIEPPSSSKKKSGSPKLVETEAKTLFSYEDESDEEEVLVFKPRGRGAPRATVNGRGSTRSRQQPRSPRRSFSSQPQTPTSVTRSKIPIEEIDPDSFDRGSFGRGGGQLANVSNNSGHHAPQNGSGRGTGGGRGGSTPTGPRNGQFRGRGAGGERGGSARGRGRLFVP